MKRTRSRNRSRSPDPEATGLDRLLATIVEGRVHRVLPRHQLPDYEAFLWQQAAPAGRYVVCFPAACGCLTWLGFTIERARPTPVGVMVRSHPDFARVPDHDEPTPDCPDRTAPPEVAGRPCWRLDIPALAAAGRGE